MRKSSLKLQFYLAIQFIIKCDLANRILDLNECSFNGVYKSTGKKFLKAFGSYISKLSNLLITQAKSDAKVETYLNANEKWKNFESTTLKERFKKENTELGAEKKFWNNQDEMNDRDENSDAKKELDNDAEEDESNKEKLNIVPEDDDSQVKIEFDDVDEVVYKKDIEKEYSKDKDNIIKEKEDNKEDNVKEEKKDNKEKDNKKEEDNKEEKDNKKEDYKEEINKEEDNKEVKKEDNKDDEKEETDASVEKVSLDKMGDSNIKPKNLVEPLLNEYVPSNYWFTETKINVCI